MNIEKMTFESVGANATENTQHQGYVNGWNDCIDAISAERDKLMAQKAKKHGTNEYGLDVGYTAGKLNLFLRDIDRYTRDEAARVLARLAIAADESVLGEPEFTRPMPAQQSAAIPEGWKLVPIEQSTSITEQDSPPITLTKEQIEVFGRPNFSCSSIARILVSKCVYAEIPPRSENEQAVAIHFMSSMLEKYGSNWKIEAEKVLKKLNAKHEESKEIHHHPV